MAVLVLVVVGCRSKGLPAPGSEAYEQTARHFFRGLANLEVGLLDDAVKELTQATTLAPGEPAAWANLGLAQLRLGAFDAAAAAIDRAAAAAPESGDVAFLQARLESLRGRREEGIAHLRRAIELDPRHLKARAVLAQEVENAGGPDANAEAQRLLEGLLELQPGSPAVLVERARLAAKRSDAPLLADSLKRLEGFVSGWPPEVATQYRAVVEASAAGNFPAAALAGAFLRNVLTRVPVFLASQRLVTPSDELIAEPFPRFLRLPVPVAAPSLPDEALTFRSEPAGEALTDPASTPVAISLDGEGRPALFAVAANEVRRVDVGGAATLGLPFPGGPSGAPRGANGLAALDWNHDFRMDLATAGAGGVRLFLQAAGGQFLDETARADAASGLSNLKATGVWAADVEMDGDVDLVVGVEGEPAVVLRNSGAGDGTWQPTRPFAGAAGLRGFAWADLDDDGDPDAALLDGGGTLHVFSNLQAGQFELLPAPAHHADIAALAASDVDADGSLDLVTLQGAAIRRASLGETGWAEAEMATWPAGAVGEPPGAARLFLADLDNNGALDLVVSGAAGTGLWLADEKRALRPLRATVDAAVWDVVDLDGDGLLDLVGLASGRPVRLLGQGTKSYHFQVLRPRAQNTSGDQRINSFALGGLMEMRSGLLAQKQIIAGPAVHFGLGTRTAVDVTRIVWPNGVPQAEFDPAVDRPVVAEQRLKGSCPWVFADDGTGFRFVTDFLWRSPLGLRINASDTAGVTQTEDWVKIRGDQLTARNGSYDFRITAELWETHFFDHVSLMVVDHPRDVEIFVDERFVPVAPPALAVRAVRPPRAVAAAWDQDGREVTDLVARQDGRYLASFRRSPYQGIAEDHFVEIDLGAPIPAGVPVWLVAHGWIYPTDSSINVAIGQGKHPRPRSLALEALDAQGRWRVVATDLGFPAGKRKTILLDLGAVARAGLPGARRLRLRTNLEIYWDSLGFAVGAPDAALETRRLDPSRAELRYRGYSKTLNRRRDLPEIPDYAQLANTAPRWRDLAGYYTRFGDVRELLQKVEDRYVILNAGDELRLSFAAPPPPPGLVRDFVLIGDGWVKDGDFNTSFAKTVLPLPAHDQPLYESSSTAPVLERDPVYLRHRADWQRFHTRYVDPRPYLDGLRLAGLAGRP
jgi:Tfp pilus assembly protein PilF